MNNNIVIPKKIKVGYCKRKDTYTGMLAYVIYYDDKGKLRKETSWENWRDHSIEPQEYANIPVSGFILNRKVGDCNSGWDHRKAYCRVFDPRGFEIEISFENLLYILEFVDCCRGKALKGDFVYGWDGKDLVLLPTCSPDYAQLISFNTKVNDGKTLKPKELKVGGTYIDKKNNKLTYMGTFCYYDVFTMLRNKATGESKKRDYWYSGEDYDKLKDELDDIDNWTIKSESLILDSKHVFVQDYSPNSKYVNFKWYSKVDGRFIEKYEEISENELNILKNYLMNESHFSPVDKVDITMYTKDEFRTMLDDKLSNSNMMTNVVSSDGSSVNVGISDYSYNDEIMYKVFKGRYFKMMERPVSEHELTDKFLKKFKGHLGQSVTGRDIEIRVTFDELYEITQPCKLVAKLASGKDFSIFNSCAY